MKKFLAAVMAAAMVVSMTSVASFATAAVHATMTFNLTDATGTGTTAGAAVVATFTVAKGGTGDETSAVFATTTKFLAADTEDKIGAALVAEETNADYSLSYNSTNKQLTVTQVSDKTTKWGTPTGAISGTATPNSNTALVVGATFREGKASTDLEAAGTADVLVALKGPFVEGTGDQAKGIVKPGKTLYYTMDNQEFAENQDLFKFTFKKGDSSKNVSTIKLVEKTFSSELVTVATTPVTVGGSKPRQYFVAVTLKDMMKDSEYKVNFEMKISAKKEIAAGNAIIGNTDVIPSGTNVGTGKIGSAWVNNYVDAGDDLTYRAGTGGVMSKPIKDENNAVTWEDANRALAKIVFTADSAVTVYYPKLSTVWDNEFYGMHFATDAFKFEFVGNPTISATARPVLSLMNPFIVDDEYTVDVADLTVYRVVDGALVDATGEFTATTDDDGNQVLVTKTRTLGTYVVTDAEAVMTAAEETVAPEKVVPNTGR